MKNSSATAAVSESRRTGTYQPDWIRVSDCPFSKAHVYRLIKAGILKSALFDGLGLGRGVRLISRRSLEQLIAREASPTK